MKGRGKLADCKEIICRDAICSVSTKWDLGKQLTVGQTLGAWHCLIPFEELRSHLAYPRLRVLKQPATTPEKLGCG